MSFRTDRNNNPTAFTTDIAASAGLILLKDYIVGDEFNADGKTFHTAKLVGDPIATTIRVIDRIGFYTKSGAQRWSYIGIPELIWDELTIAQKKGCLQFMYHHEGGTELEGLFR